MELFFNVTLNDGRILKNVQIMDWNLNQLFLDEDKIKEELSKINYHCEPVKQYIEKQKEQNAIAFITNTIIDEGITNEIIDERIRYKNIKNIELIRILKI